MEPNKKKRGRPRKAAAPQSDDVYFTDANGRRLPHTENADGVVTAPEGAAFARVVRSSGGRKRRKPITTKLYQRPPLYFALAKCADIVERRFRKLEALQVTSGGNAAMISKIWN